MPRQRDSKRDEAFEIWKKHKGNITNRAIAEQLDVPEKTVSAWKSRDKWNAVLQKNDCSTTKENVSKNSRSSSRKNKEKPIVESDELTDKQRFFAMYFVKYFNATKAYQKAYDCAYSTAMVNGHGLLRNTKIASEIDRLKKSIADGIMLDGTAVLQKYIDIAFADITDFVEFGREEVTDDLGNPYEVNRVKFRESNEVDGTIITEIKKGKDGVSIKLADKMKALDFLSKYTDLLSENDRKKLQEEKVKTEIEKTKAEINKLSGVDDEATINGLDQLADAIRKSASTFKGDE